MENSAEAKVMFGKVAGTLVYEDELGQMVFVFDVSPAKDDSTGKWKLYLNSQPLVNGKVAQPKTESEWQRIATAVEGTKQYAESRGYLIEVR